MHYMFFIFKFASSNPKYFWNRCLLIGMFLKSLYALCNNTMTDRNEMETKLNFETNTTFYHSAWDFVLPASCFFFLTLQVPSIYLIHVKWLHFCW